MRTVGGTVLAVLLFGAAFAVVRAQESGLQAELAALESAAGRLRERATPERFDLPPPPQPIHRIRAATVVSPVFLREPPGYVDAYWRAVEGFHSGPGPSEDAYQPFGTIEEVAELLCVREEQNGHPRPTLLAEGFELLYRGPRQTADRIAGYLENELKPLVVRTARVEVDWEMGAGRGTPGFRARLLSLVGSRSMFWVGRQQVFLPDTDVTPTAGPDGMSDPRIARVFSGELVLPDIVAASGSLVCDLRFDSRRFELPLRRIATRESGLLDMPRSRDTRFRGAVRLAPGRWMHLHRADGTLRIRAEVVER